MTEETADLSVPVWFRVVSVIALLWYLMDTSAFFMRVFITDELLQAMPQVQRQHLAGIPSWVNFVFAFEVFGGTLGCICLLIRRKWALPLFIASILGVLSQTTHIWFMSDAVSLMGSSAVVMPLVAIVLGAAMIVLCRAAIAKGWLQ
ncbi:MAG: hypothetical protein HOM68_29080 [Gemmatimonadetes bacterium]|jgi:hypothetical protein|nr:hypothetical protein [Gemmatimonadota bacterium]MBT5060634.1 hypothetical protein [Gemmatimonadota bacterium]MBT5141606.1 hypothetical protein [Gemmatimonadota bacterium]MBT5590909.1 hypothetical protein [Gemmatimonadota bacterium]MBT5965027.1 hypothetical protein [Gemmatimonadota bacterium]